MKQYKKNENGPKNYCVKYNLKREKGIIFTKLNKKNSEKRKNQRAQICLISSFFK